MIDASDSERSGVCVVVVDYATSIEVLSRTVRNVFASKNFYGHEISVILVDNGGRDNEFQRTLLPEFPALRVLTGHGNVGFGAGNNLAIPMAKEPFILFLNPDAFVAPECIGRGVSYLAENPGVALLCPHVVNDLGHKEYLCRSYPSVRALLGRFLGGSVFKAANREYEKREVDWSISRDDFDIASGCFMLCRTSDVRRVRGFDEVFFLYFEDYDLSLRLKKYGRLVYLPQMHVTHLGGGVARKNFFHKKHFVRSAWHFFSRHGWKW